MTTEEAQEIWQNADPVWKKIFLSEIEIMFSLADDLVDDKPGVETQWNELPIETRNMLIKYFETLKQKCSLSMREWWKTLNISRRHTLLACLTIDLRKEVGAQAINDVARMDWEKLHQELKSAVEIVRKTDELFTFSKFIKLDYVLGEQECFYIYNKTDPAKQYKLQSRILKDALYEALQKLEWNVVVKKTQTAS